MSKNTTTKKPVRKAWRHGTGYGMIIRGRSQRSSRTPIVAECPLCWQTQEGSIDNAQ